MNKKYLIIGGVIVIVAIAAALAITHSGEIKYTTLDVSKTCSLQVPESNNVESLDNDSGIFCHIDKEHNLNITSYNGAESNNSSAMDKMNSLVENQKLNSQTLEENGTTIHYNKDAGTYAIFLSNNETQDNVLIITHDKDLALAIANSVKYGENNSNTTHQYGGENSSSGYFSQ